MFFVFVFVKLNFFLYVGLIWFDWYYDVDSLVVFIEFGDEVRIELLSGIKFSIDGLFVVGF